MRLTFEVPGAPRGKGRPRFRRNGQTYTDAKTVTYEKLIADAAGEAMAEGPTELPCSLELVVEMPVPSSWPKWQQLQALANIIRPTVKPDLDNVLKIVGDACNGVVWVDDKQLVSTRVVKRYSDTPRLIVTIVDTPAP